MELGELRKRALLRGLRRQCPQCGVRALHKGYARLRDDCGECGLVLRREQGAQTGTMYLTAAASQVLAAALIFGVHFGTDWSVGVSVAVVLPSVLLFCAVILPVCQTFWVAVEYMTDVSNGESWVSSDSFRPS